jgi:hypothetical protein
MNIFYRGLFLISILSSVIAKASEYIPTQLNDGWATASPNNEGLDVGFVDELRKKSLDGTYKELISVIYP